MEVATLDALPTTLEIDGAGHSVVFLARQPGLPKKTTNQ
jgi:hypothetical protein